MEAENATRAAKQRWGNHFLLPFDLSSQVIRGLEVAKALWLTYRQEDDRRRTSCPGLSASSLGRQSFSRTNVLTSNLYVWCSTEWMTFRLPDVRNVRCVISFQHACFDTFN